MNKLSGSLCCFICASPLLLCVILQQQFQIESTINNNNNGILKATFVVLISCKHPPHTRIHIHTHKIKYNPSSYTTQIIRKPNKQACKQTGRFGVL